MCSFLFHGFDSHPSHGACFLACQKEKEDKKTPRFVMKHDSNYIKSIKYQIVFAASVMLSRELFSAHWFLETKVIINYRRVEKVQVKSVKTEMYKID